MVLLVILSLSLVVDSKVFVAKLADDSLQQSRRFYQPPVVYKFMDEDNEEVISVSMGSGYRAHQLSTDMTDRIYSFRFPIQTDRSS